MTGIDMLVVGLTLTTLVLWTRVAELTEEFLVRGGVRRLLAFPLVWATWWMLLGTVSDLYLQPLREALQ